MINVDSLFVALTVKAGTLSEGLVTTPSMCCCLISEASLHGSREDRRL